LPGVLLTEAFSPLKWPAKQLAMIRGHREADVVLICDA
jgi:hypothetical protein